MSTHDKQMLEAISCTLLSEVHDKVSKYDVIGIDEGQFFEDIVEFSEKFANEGKIIVIAALDGSFERKRFGNVIDLIPMAERVVKLDAVCIDCKEPASFTKRLIESMETEVIGGAEIYKPVCRQCFNKDQKQRTPLKEITDSKSKFIDLDSPIMIDDENKSGLNYAQGFES